MHEAALPAVKHGIDVFELSMSFHKYCSLLNLLLKWLVYQPVKSGSVTVIHAVTLPDSVCAAVPPAPVLRSHVPVASWLQVPTRVSTYEWNRID